MVGRMNTLPEERSVANTLAVDMSPGLLGTTTPRTLDPGRRKTFPGITSL
jgi:hypothetical protein